MPESLHLNERTKRLADHMAQTSSQLRIGVHTLANGARILDCGVTAEGGLQAGLSLARCCLANLAEVALVPGQVADYDGPMVQVSSDWPVAACMASQYAGWQIEVGNYFAMGSGPIRAAAGKEELFDAIGYRESPSCVVGVLESRKLPADEVIAYLADGARVDAGQLTLLIAPASSQAGAIQVVARAVETALHKLHELGFDLGRVVSAYGIAPLPPVAGNELQAIGRTNDSILYGGRVELWVRGDDDTLTDVGPRVPASASPDYGEPFEQIFKRYGQDFYRIDPLLFSPATIRFSNLDTGHVHSFGRLEYDVLRRSFGE